MKSQEMKHMKFVVLMETAYIGLAWAFPLFGMLGVFLDLSSWKSWVALWVAFLLLLTVVLMCVHLAHLLGTVLDRSDEITNTLKRIADKAEAQ